MKKTKKLFVIAFAWSELERGSSCATRKRLCTQFSESISDMHVWMMLSQVDLFFVHQRHSRCLVALFLPIATVVHWKNIIFQTRRPEGYCRVLKPWLVVCVQHICCCITFATSVAKLDLQVLGGSLVFTQENGACGGRG